MSERREAMEQNAVSDAAPGYRAVRTEITTGDVSPGYHRTEVGGIPEDWEIKSLSEIADLRNGYAFKSATYREDAFYKIVTIANVQDGYLSLEACSAIKSLPSDLQDHQVLSPGDILISMTGNVGRACVNDQNNCLLNQRVGKLIPRSIDRQFLFFTVHDRRFMHEMIESAVGGAQGNLGKTDILGYLCLVPSEVEEQRAIATTLSDADALIESLDRLIAKKHAIKQAAMEQLLTGQTRLPGFEGEWETKWLGDVARIGTGDRNNQDKTPQGKYSFFVRSESIERIDSYSFDCEAILVPGEGRIGNILHYINGKFDVHQRVYAIREFDSSVDARFVYFYMVHQFGAWAFQNTVKATVDSLRLPTFKKFPMGMPVSVNEQAAIAGVLSDMDSEIESLECRRDTARQIKQGMMQQLLTGRVRLA